MKKLVTLLILLLFIGCGKKSNDNSSTQNKQHGLKDITASERNNTYHLKYKLVKGKEYNYKITSISDQTESVSDKDSTSTNNVRQNATYTLNLKFDNLDDDSIYSINCKISAIKVDFYINGVKETYQSGVTPDSLIKSRYAEYDALVNNDFSIRVSELGDISEISRIDKMTNKFLKLKGITDSVTPEQKDQLRMQITEGIIRPIISQVFREVPTKAVGIDSTWSIRQPSTQILAFEAQNTINYDLKKIEMGNGSKLALVSASMTTEFKGKSDVTQHGVRYHFNKPETQGSGEIYLNLNDGMVQNSKTSTKVNISFSAEYSRGSMSKKIGKTSSVINTNEVERI